jgi:hypothetical protein
MHHFFLSKKICTLFVLASFCVSTVAAQTVSTSNAPHAALSMSSQASEVREGDIVQVTFVLDPLGIPIYKLRESITFDQTLLSLTKWSYASSWQPLRSGDNDSFSNDNGTLIRTAEYEGGVTSRVTFGTATFTALKTGSAVITLTQKSFAYDKDQKNVVSLPVPLTITVRDKGSSLSGATTTPSVATSTSVISTTVLPDYLDVKNLVVQRQIKHADELKVRTTIASNIATSTSVTFEYFVVNSEKKILFSSKEVNQVAKEVIFEKVFEGLNLGDGSYVVVTRIKYADVSGIHFFTKTWKDWVVVDNSISWYKYISYFLGTLLLISLIFHVRNRRRLRVLVTPSIPTDFPLKKPRAPRKKKAIQDKE